MKNYKINSDCNYKDVHPDLDEVAAKHANPIAFLDAIDDDSENIGNLWFPVEGVVDGMGEIADISRHTGGDIVLSPKAYSILESVIEPYGECLAIALAGETYMLFRCLNWIDAADPEKSRLNKYNEVEQLALVEGKIEGQLLWATKLGTMRGLFCGESFKKLIDAEELTGLKFKELPTRISP